MGMEVSMGPWLWLEKSCPFGILFDIKIGSSCEIKLLQCSMDLAGFQQNSSRHFGTAWDLSWAAGISFISRTLGRAMALCLSLLPQPYAGVRETTFVWHDSGDQGNWLGNFKFFDPWSNRRTRNAEASVFGLLAIRRAQPTIALYTSSFTTCIEMGLFYLEFFF